MVAVITYVDALQYGGLIVGSLFLTFVVIAIALCDDDSHDNQFPNLH